MCVILFTISTHIHKCDNILQSLPTSLYEREEEKNSPFMKGERRIPPSSKGAGGFGVPKFQG
jgi:hypothetical protein